MKKILNLLLLITALTSAQAQTTPTVVKDIKPGTGLGVETDAFMDELNGKVLFFAEPSDTSRHWLYSSDGTDAGTVPVARVSRVLSDDYNFYKWNNALYWLGGDSASYFDNYLLLKTDGTTSGTITIFNPGPFASALQPRFVNNNSRLFFIGMDSTRACIFSTDGTIAGAQRIFYPYTSALYQYNLYGIVNNLLVFNNGYSIYASNGTTAGTQLIYTAQDNITGGTVMGQYLYFCVYGELWRTDGTAAGTTIVTSIFSSPELLAVAGNKLFIKDGNKLYCTDGTNAGTTLVNSSNSAVPLSLSASPVMGVIGNKLIFSSSGAVEGSEAWVTNGTTTGTFMLKDICIGSGTSYIDNSATDTVNGVVYFTAKECNSTSQMYRTDGTINGTYQVNNKNIGTTSFTKFHIIDGLVYYGTIASGIGAEMFVTNGLPGGTLTYDLSPGTGYSNPNHWTKAGNKIFFKAMHPTKGYEVWSFSAPVISGINENIAQPTITIYPNPGTDVLYINAPAEKIERVNIYSIDGSLLLSTQNDPLINTAGLPNGSYIVEISIGKATLYKKWIKL